MQCGIHIRESNQWNRTVVPEMDPHKLPVDSPERCQGNSVGERRRFFKMMTEQLQFIGGNEFQSSSHCI